MSESKDLGPCAGPGGLSLNPVLDVAGADESAGATWRVSERTRGARSCAGGAGGDQDASRKRGKPDVLPNLSQPLPGWTCMTAGQAGSSGDRTSPRERPPRTAAYVPKGDTKEANQAGGEDREREGSSEGRTGT